jgi:L-cysteine S-thiosulfotransferase
MGRRCHWRAVAAAAGAAGLWIAAPPALAEPQVGLRGYEVTGDAIVQPLTGTPGDAARGQRIVGDRFLGLCLLCHRGPFPNEAQGSLAPDLAGAGARWSEGQLRLRIVDARRLNPATIMPSYYRSDGLERVGSAWRDRPVLDPQQIEDVVAYLRTLRD